MAQKTTDFAGGRLRLRRLRFSRTRLAQRLGERGWHVPVLGGTGRSPETVARELIG